MSLDRDPRWIALIPKIHELFQDLAAPGTSVPTASDCIVLLAAIAASYATLAFSGGTAEDHYFKREWILMLFKHTAEQCGIEVGMIRSEEVGYAENPDADAQLEELLSRPKAKKPALKH